MSAPSAEQMEVFFSFLEEHRDLARGLLRNIEGRVASLRLWEEITATLNGMGGCTKTVQQWQRVWTDRKYLAKRNIAAARRSASTTGGGPSTAPQPTRWDLRVMSIMGDGFGGPQTTARVPAFVESPPHESEPEPQSPILEFNVNEPLQHSASESQLRRSAIIDAPRHEPLQNIPTQRPTQTRRRRVRERHTGDSDSVTRRFLGNEERRLARGAELNNHLSGIRTALTELIQILREYMTRNQ